MLPLVAYIIHILSFILENRTLILFSLQVGLFVLTEWTYPHFKHTHTPHPCHQLQGMTCHCLKDRSFPLPMNGHELSTRSFNIVIKVILRTLCYNFNISELILLIDLSLNNEPFISSLFCVLPFFINAKHCVWRTVETEVNDIHSQKWACLFCQATSLGELSQYIQ